MVIVGGKACSRSEEKSLGAEMSYSMKRFCIRIKCKKKQEKENREYTVLNEITEKMKVHENHNDQQPEPEKQPQQQHTPQTPKSGVRICTRISRPPEQYSPSVYYVLLIDSSEPECYEEAAQVETRKK